MGKGAVQYVKNGIGKILSREGHLTKIEKVDTNESFDNEVASTGRVCSQLAKIVKKALKGNYFPLVLGGNCNTCIGTLMGIGTRRIGVIWFDAHGDFNTPDTTITGFLDGMGLATVTGYCYKAFFKKIGLKNYVSPNNVILVGVRDLDAAEKILVKKAGVHVISAGKLRRLGVKRAFLPPFAKLNKRVDDIYLHIDIDVVDPYEAPGVDFRSQYGLTTMQVIQSIFSAAKRFRIKGAALTAYNPKYDKGKKTLKTGLRILITIANAVAKSDKD